MVITVAKGFTCDGELAFEKGFAAEIADACGRLLLVTMVVKYSLFLVMGNG